MTVIELLLKRVIYYWKSIVISFTINSNVPTIINNAPSYKHGIKRLSVTISHI